jgi:hypothetical protein
VFLMRAKRAGTTAVAVVALGGCEVDKNRLLAPSDAVINLTAAATLLPASGSTTVTVTVEEITGEPVDDGTEVVMTATRGNLDQAKVRVRNGTAQVGYRASTEPGSVRIEASSGSARSGLDLTVMSAPPGQISIAADRTVLPHGGGKVEVVAVVTASGGQAVVGAPVRFEANGGQVGPRNAMSDAEGKARTSLTTTAAATVTARVESVRSSELRIAVQAAIGLRIGVSPAQPIAGQPATFTVTPSEPAPGVLFVFFGDGASAELGPASAASTTTYAYARPGAFNATAAYSPPEGQEVRETMRVTVVEPPPPPPPPPPTPPTPAPTPPAPAPPAPTPPAPTPPAPTPPAPTPPAPTPPAPTPPPAPAPRCNFEISPATESVPAEETTVRVRVRTAAECGWTAVSSASWIVVSSGASGRGDGNVRLQVAPNSTTIARTGTATIAGLTSTIVQAAAAAPAPLPSPPPPTGGGNDELPVPLSQVTWLHTDVSRWSVTSRITGVSIDNPPVCIEHTKSGDWPVRDGIEGNPWIFANVGGKWYAATYEWLRPGQTCKIAVKTSTIGPLTKKEPLESWTPRSGELVGFMVSTPARPGATHTVSERTNIVMRRWP